MDFPTHPRRIARATMAQWSFLLGAWLLAFVSVEGRAADIILDGNNPGRVFDGIGAVSAGASTRLLIDYPEPQRSEILDLLFKPKAGASFQRLKVEIGGGVNSTDGTEPTHMRSRDDLDFNRGYEWWLMKEARKRNPSLILECLAWGAPDWLGTYYSTNTAEYIAKFLEGARQVHGLDIQFVGIHNERPYDTEWIKTLRRTLDAHQLQSVKIVAGEQVGTWDIADQIAADPELAGAVYALGAHYSGSESTPAAQQSGKPIWSSEDGPWAADWPAARILGKLLNRNYVTGKMTATEVWSLLSSYYEVLPLPDSGPIFARQPWSGHYSIQPTFWPIAHTTQFTEPGWHYLAGTATGMLPEGGSCVTLVSPDRKQFSLIIETFDAAAPQTLNFVLTNGVTADQLQIWRTTLSESFRELVPVAVSNGKFSLTVEPEAIYTVTTTTGQQRPASTTVSKPFPAPYVEDFESYPAGATPRYLSDQAGTFEVAELPGQRGNALRQIAESPGLPWAIQYTPWTTFGARFWTDYELSFDAFLENDGFISLFGRVGKVIGFSDPVPYGYIAIIRSNPGRWEIWRRDTMIASGTTTFATNVWHSVRLVLDGAHVQLWLDGTQLGEAVDGGYSAGLAGLGSGWHTALFDNLVVRPLHTRRNLAQDAVITASNTWSPEFDPHFAADHDWDSRWVGGAGNGVGQWLQLSFTNAIQFNRAVVWDDDRRVTNCAWQVWQTDHWRTIAAGIQPQILPGVQFQKVTADRVRLLINASATPIVREIELFDDEGSPGPRINEWMTENSSVTNPATGTLSPWFELYNPASTNIDIGGLYLSATRSNRFEAQIPSGRALKPGEFLRIWADQRSDLNQANGDLHLNLTLQDDGVLGIFGPDGRQQDFVEFQSPGADQVFGSNPDGSTAVSILGLPSPGASNGQVSATSISMISNGTVVARFKGAPFAKYQIQSNASVAGGTWVDGETQTADGSGSVRFYLTKSAAASFFRVIAR